MKKILLIANTYFQVIIAINLKLTVLKNEQVDIIITDISTNSKKITSNIHKTNLFNKIHVAKTDYLCYKANLFIKYKSFIFDRNILKKFVDKEDYNYDVLMFFNYDIFTYSIFNKIYSLNKSIECHRFEEGFISYLYDFSHLIGYKVHRFIRKLSLKPSIEEKISKYYFFNPDLLLFKPNYQLEKIENLNKYNIELKNILNTVFNYININDKYNQKYIFFEESFFCDGRQIDDLELILNIASIVGKDNIMVKLHPRNKVDRFSKYGIATNKTIGVPWEIIQMNNDFSEKVFLTISSGSVLASRLYFNENIKTYLLYNCTDRMSDMVDDKYHEYLDRVRDKFGINNFIIPENKNEFLDLLKNEE